MLHNVSSVDFLKCYWRNCSRQKEPANENSKKRIKKDKINSNIIGIESIGFLPKEYHPKTYAEFVQ
jgi:hypothetical protein